MSLENPTVQENISPKEKYQEVWDAVKDRSMQEAREMVALAYDLRPVAVMQADVSADEEKQLMGKIEVFKKSGLFVESYDHTNEDDRAEAKKSLSFYISKDPVLAQECKEISMAVERPIPKEFHNRFGQLMGYPQTAIDAYINGDCLYEEEKEALGIPLQDDEDGRGIVPFGMSREHYAEETAYIQKYFTALKEVFPDTYGTALSGETLDIFKKEVEVFLNEDYSKKKIPEKLAAKVKRLKEIENGLEDVGDGRGLGIDEDIKPTVAILNAIGVNTMQSCEGHIGEHGLPLPWVRVGASDEPDEQWVGQSDAFKEAAREHNVPLEKLLRGEPENLYWEVLNNIMEREETVEFKEWEEKNRLLHERMEHFLRDFYKERKVPKDIALEIIEGRGDTFDIRSKEERIPQFLRKELSEQELAEMNEKLYKRQNEMTEFTDFLRKYYFSDEFDGQVSGIYERVKIPEALSGKEVSKIAETLYGQVSPEFGAHFVESNVVLTLSGLKAQTEFYHDVISEEDTNNVKEYISLLNRFFADKGIEFVVRDEPEQNQESENRYFMVGVIIPPRSWTA